MDDLQLRALFIVKYEAKYSSFYRREIPLAILEMNCNTIVN